MWRRLTRERHLACWYVWHACLFCMRKVLADGYWSNSATTCRHDISQDILRAFFRIRFQFSEGTCLIIYRRVTIHKTKLNTNERFIKKTTDWNPFQMGRVGSATRAHYAAVFRKTWRFRNIYVGICRSTTTLMADIKAVVIHVQVNSNRFTFG